MGLTTCAGWRKVICCSLAPAAVSAIVGTLDHLFLPYRFRRR